MREECIQQKEEETLKISITSNEIWIEQDGAMIIIEKSSVYQLIDMLNRYAK